MMTDNELIAGCIRHNKICQEALYKKFYGKMMGVCLRYAKDRDEASDMLQEGFIKVFNSICNFASKGSFEGWVRRIIVNTAVDHLRKNKHAYLIMSTVYVREGDIPDTADEIEEENLLNNLSQEEILLAISQLSPAYRTVFNLYVMDELQHKEIGIQLGISEGTSKSNLAKARFQLKKNLNNLSKKTDGKRTATK